MVASWGSRDACLENPVLFLGGSWTSTRPSGIHNPFWVYLVGPRPQTSWPCKPLKGDVQGAPEEQLEPLLDNRTSHIFLKSKPWSWQQTSLQPPVLKLSGQSTNFWPQKGRNVEKNFLQGHITACTIYSGLRGPAMAPCHYKWVCSACLCHHYIAAQHKSVYYCQLPTYQPHMLTLEYILSVASSVKNDSLYFMSLLPAGLVWFL